MCPVMLLPRGLFGLGNFANVNNLWEERDAKMMELCLIL